MTSVTADRISKRFANGVQALDDVSLAVAQGEFFTIVGPTNAGKSTLLKTIAGLVRPDRGRIIIDGVDATPLEPRQRRLSLLFQNIALFPSLTGFDNMAFPLRAARKSEQETRARVTQLATMLKVSHVLDRLPRTFSGGEQQRVAIGRALAVPGRALLLDEPLSNLDARIRIALRVAFKALHRDTGQTILYVTHDQVEAFSLSDRIAVLNGGKVEQVGTPDEIYRRPVNRFVATFMGLTPINFLNAEVTADGAARSAAFTAPLGAARLGMLPRGPIALGIRPEAVRVSRAQDPQTPFAAEVTRIEKLGAKQVIELSAGSELIRALVPRDHEIVGEGPAFFGFDPASAHLLDVASNRFIYS